jgi:hypothetical protein
VLVVTILFAPIGFLVCLGIRAVRKSAGKELAVDVGSRP